MHELKLKLYKGSEERIAVSLSMIFTDNVALSQSDAMISVAYISAAVGQNKLGTGMACTTHEALSYPATLLCTKHKKGCVIPRPRQCKRFIIFSIKEEIASV